MDSWRASANTTQQEGIASGANPFTLIDHGEGQRITRPTSVNVSTFEMFDLIKEKIFWKGGKKPGFYQYVVQAKVDWRIQDRIEIKKEKMQL